MLSGRLPDSVAGQRRDVETEPTAHRQPYIGCGLVRHPSAVRVHVQILTRIPLPPPLSEGGEEGGDQQRSLWAVNTVAFEDVLDQGPVGGGGKLGADAFSGKIECPHALADSDHRQASADPIRVVSRVLGQCRPF